MLFEFWAWLLTTGAAFALIIAYGIATLRYRLGENGLEILALGAPFRTIPYADIQSAHLGGSLLNEHWVTFRLANRVTLHLRRGRRHAMVITPPDPEAFLRELEARLQPAPAPHLDPPPGGGGEGEGEPRSRLSGRLTLVLLILGLAQAETAEFRLALPGYAFSFPRDHYAHEEFRTEWWYYTGHLRSQDGNDYGYQVTFFRSGVPEARANPSRWAPKNLYLAHFAISDIPRKMFRYFEQINRAGLGQAGASDKALRVWIGDWEVSGDGRTQRLRAKEEGFALDLTLVSQKPPVIHGENGVSQKGEGRGHASHYYSLTRLKTEGTLTLGGKTLPVTGLSWMDHEFGSTQLHPGQVGWDWFSLQFTDGTELMLYIIRQTDGRPDPYSAGTWVAADGRTRFIRQPDFSVEVLDRWKSPRGKGVYPMKWRIRLPALGLEMTLTPAFPDQELDTAKSTRVIYWEGAVFAEGTIQGRPARGRGYVEMTGYAEPFRKKL